MFLHIDWNELYWILVHWLIVVSLYRMCHGRHS